jgi:hypothetical protein
MFLSCDFIFFFLSFVSFLYLFWGLSWILGLLSMDLKKMHKNRRMFFFCHFCLHWQEPRFEGPGELCRVWSGWIELPHDDCDPLLRILYYCRMVPWLALEVAHC